jgi:hypothetical protein
VVGEEGCEGEVSYGKKTKGQAGGFGALLTLVSSKAVDKTKAPAETLAGLGRDFPLVIVASSDTQPPKA